MDAADSHRDGIDQKGKLKMISGSFYIAKDKGSSPQGDDSHFICEEKQTIGVADGVGGWSRHGIDPGVYARELIDNSLLATLTQPLTRVDPMKVLGEAFMKTKAQGASTACIITLQDNNMLLAVNVGDSGFMVIREGKSIYRSPIQQHSFNFPYQLGNSPYSDKPWQAQVIRVAVEEGDVIIAGTDGLFDNMSEYKISKAVSIGIGRGLNLEEIAWYLAQKAYLKSMNDKGVTPKNKLVTPKKKVVTPFMKALTRTTTSSSTSYYFEGGKPDDITVIASRILRT